MYVPMHIDKYYHFYERNTLIHTNIVFTLNLHNLQCTNVNA